MQSLMWEEFLGSNVDCYMKASPQLLCTKVKRGESSCNRGKEFLCSSVVFYIRTGSLLFCTDVAREGGSSREEGSCKNPFETR